MLGGYTVGLESFYFDLDNLRIAICVSLVWTTVLGVVVVVVVLLVMAVPFGVVVLVITVVMAVPVPVMVMMGALMVPVSMVMVVLPMVTLVMASVVDAVMVAMVMVAVAVMAVVGVVALMAKAKEPLSAHLALSDFCFCVNEMTAISLHVSVRRAIGLVGYQVDSITVNLSLS